MKQFFFIFLLLPFLQVELLAQSRTCVIQGEVIGRESTHLLLYRAVSHRLNPIDTIEIQNGQFHYTFDYTNVEAYNLVFKDELEMGAWMSILFFPSEQLTFKLHHHTDYAKNTISGDVYSEQHKAKTERDEVEFYKPINDLDQQLKTLREKGDTMELKAAEAAFKAALAEYRQSNFAAMKELVNPLAYHYLSEDIKYKVYTSPKDLEEAKKIYHLLAAQMPNHPYTDLLASSFKDDDWIGQSFIDFQALNRSGQVVSIKSELSAKLTLINFWGSWCGPCIKKTREELIPIYETYRELGLEYIGVAREFGGVERFKAALKREQYPWKNFYDLDDQYHIWAKYDQLNTAGWTMLIDQTGTILAIDPLEAELRALIDANL